MRQLFDFPASLREHLGKITLQSPIDFCAKTGKSMADQVSEKPASLLVKPRSTHAAA